MHEQRRQFGTGFRHLLRTKELPRMATQVRMKNRLFPSSSDRIALCAGIRAMGETVPAAFSNSLGSYKEGGKLLCPMASVRVLWRAQR